MERCKGDAIIALAEDGTLHELGMTIPTSANVNIRS